MKCDGRRPQCTRCTTFQKQCQYTASRRGGLDRAALAERRKRLATGGDARLSNVTSQMLLGARDEQIPQLSAQPVIDILDNVYDVLDGNLTNETSTSTSPETPQPYIENIEKDPLVDSYYTNFHVFHPFLLPRQHLTRLSQDPTQQSALSLNILIAVMRLVGHIYNTHQWSTSLKDHAEFCISQLSSFDPIQVQCRLLFSIALFWNNYKVEAKREMDAAINLAIELRMHQQEFPVHHGAGDPVLTECWRRTWWMLFIVDAYYAGTLGTMNFKSFHVQATVELPCEEAEYESGVSTQLPIIYPLPDSILKCPLNQIIPEPQTIEAFDSREFSLEETSFSSFAYLIGAVRCAALAVSIAPKNATKDDSEGIIQSADSVIDAWLLLLPKDRKQVMKKTGVIDELMFQAHLLVHV